MTVTVKHSKTNAISDWTQAQLDEQIALGNFAEGTVLADIVLPSDWNNDHTLTGVGTMAEQDANSVAITGGSINGTTIGATTASTGVFTTLTVNNTTGTSLANIWSNTNTSPIADLQFTRGTTSTWGGDVYTDYKLRASGGNFVVQSQNNATSVLDLLTFDEANNAVKFSPGGIEQARVSRTTSAVNYVQVTGAATGANPSLSAQGSDASVNLQIAAKGGGTVSLSTNGVGSAGQFVVSHTSSAVNYYTATGSAAGFSPRLFAQGNDTNIPLALITKGTGAINLAAGSSGVNISNGGTVTAITRTAQGTGYTTLTGLTWSASAPTTAGGVTATGTVTTLGGVSATIVNGGTGYTAGNVLTVSGGTFSSASTITVNAVSGGVITSATLTNGGTYTVVPSNPVSVTGGSGTGATFNISYGVLGLAIGTAGSGYIEQPTISFSGGGGSGAAAYATVGSTTVTRSLGTLMDFYTPAGLSFEVTDSAATPTAYLQVVSGGSGQNGGYIRSNGSATNPNVYFQTKGSGSFGFYSNYQVSTAQQFNITHTASAVNYVQVTGAATGSGPIISTQGSDTNATLTLRSKGTFAVTLQSSAGANIFEAIPTASSVNYLRVTPSIASSAPILSAQGSDTNIDLALTPKGTGRVKFGTYTATVTAVAGYIEILDAGGTLRKLAVLT